MWYAGQETMSLTTGTLQAVWQMIIGLRTTDELGGPDPNEAGTDELGGPEPDEPGTDTLGGPEPGV